MCKYQILLTPVEAYFFGGEKHSKKAGSNSGFEMDFFVRSELYPQQTTLLGVLRYYLLMKYRYLNPQKIGKTNEANQLIGESSFSYTNSARKQEFGKIKQISPLYFEKNDSYFHNESQKYLISPFDYQFRLKKDYGEYMLDGYDAKKGYTSVLMNITDNSVVDFFQDGNKSPDFVFIQVDSVGNKKGEKGKSEDDGFYKQIMYKLNTNWSFSFEAEIDLKLEEDHKFLSFGAEKQVFSFSIKKIDDFTDLKLPLAKKDLPAIFSISDCFVWEELWNDVLFAVNESISFRNLQSSNSSQNYSSFSKGYKLSKRYNLLKRGSILYFENKEKRNNAIALFSNTNSENIGFNRIQTF